MEKYFLPLVIAILVLSTLTVTAVGQDYAKNHQGEQICVESHSCALNYTRNHEKDKE
jgi:hypothetical protein